MDFTEAMLSHPDEVRNERDSLKEKVRTLEAENLILRSDISLLNAKLGTIREAAR